MVLSRFSTATTNAFSVTDAAGNGNDAVTLTVSASDGTVSLAAPTGLTVKGSGTAASPLTLSGSLALLNADLAAGLIFKPNSNDSGPDVVDLSILDTSDQAQGSTATLLVTVTPLPPTLTTPAPLNVNQNASLALSGERDQRERPGRHDREVDRLGGPWLSHCGTVHGFDDQRQWDRIGDAHGWADRSQQRSGQPRLHTDERLQRHRRRSR